MANSTRPAEFIYDNMMIHATVVHAAHPYEAQKLLYLGGSCIYPRECPQPIREEYMLTGPLEPTSESYAIAKIAGIKLCQAYRRQCGSNFVSAMPTNLCGPNDSFDLQSSHVLPALIRKFHGATHPGNSEVTIWGAGTPKREFLHVDDLADCCGFGPFAVTPRGRRLPKHERPAGLRNRRAPSGAQVRYRVTPLTTLTLLADSVRERFTELPIRNNDGSRILPGVEFGHYALIQGKAQVGYRTFDTLQSGMWTSSWQRQVDRYGSRIEP